MASVAGAGVVLAATQGSGVLAASTAALAGTGASRGSPDRHRRPGGLHGGPDGRRGPALARCRYGQVRRTSPSVASRWSVPETQQKKWQPSSLDHLVGAGEEGGWDRQVEGRAVRRCAKEMPLANVNGKLAWNNRQAVPLLDNLSPVK